jgi:hypothetical protein
MTTPRRRLIRMSAPPQPNSDPQRQRRLSKLRTRLERERTALVRWWSRFRRAFNTVEKLQSAIPRLEHRFAQLEET